jgi:predicted RNA binding protein YcfA (HicA-like mRNA interferase family)
MGYSAQVWDQLKNLSADDLVRSLKKKGWEKEDGRGAIHVYRNSDGKRVGIHYHPQKTYGAKLLKDLLTDIGWSEKELRELKLIK